MLTDPGWTFTYLTNDRVYTERREATSPGWFVQEMGVQGVNSSSLTLASLSLTAAPKTHSVVSCLSWEVHAQGGAKKLAEGIGDLVAQSCLTLCDPMDCSPPDSSVHWILQARILEWVAISLSRESSRPRDQTRVCRIVGRRFTFWATREALCRHLENSIFFPSSFTEISLTCCCHLVTTSCPTLLRPHGL